MINPRPFVLLALLVTLAVPPDAARADKRLEGIACRSVHLGYRAPKGDAFVNAVTVEKSAPGTYFCACGFGKGYFGLQELANGKRLLIFSVWDPGRQNDPNVVEDDRRVKLLFKDDDVRVGRFGNEGTGGQSFLDFDWRNGETYHLAVSSVTRGERTAYTGWFHDPRTKAWRKLVTFSTLAGGRPVDGQYAFVEDFRRNRESTQHVRRALFGPTWVRSDGEWQPVREARFTGDANPATNVDAGPAESGFFLATGGDTENATTTLRAVMKADKVDRPEELLESLADGLD